MFGSKTLNRHAALMNRMAETLGVDLEEALRLGKISSADWRDALVECVGCVDPACCAQWLGEHAAPEDRLAKPPQDCPPEFCNNRMLMERLRETLTTAENTDPPETAPVKE